MILQKTSTFFGGDPMDDPKLDKTLCDLSPRFYMRGILRNDCIISTQKYGHMF